MLNLENFINYANNLHQTSVDNGFYETKVEKLQSIGLFHEEVSELGVSFRKKTSDHACDKEEINLTQMQEELADIVIRAFDHIGYHGTCNLSYGDYKKYHDQYNLDYSYLRKPVGVIIGIIHRFIEMQTVGALIAHIEQLSSLWGVDIWNCVEIKAAYNKTRERKHGKSY